MRDDYFISGFPALLSMELVKEPLPLRKGIGEHKEC
jgi:hypothetical protein